MYTSTRVASLWDMLELNARNFLAAVSELRAIQVVIGAVQEKHKALGDVDRVAMKAHLARMIEAIEAIGARSAFRSTERLRNAFEVNDPDLTYASVSLSLADIESRFADHLDDIVLFVVPDQQARLFGDAAALMGDDDDLVIYFPTATFELEEAAKCLALGRPTASAFHSMRMLEIGIKALAAHLGIPDPVKATDRSWGNVLKAIRDAIDAKFPKSGRVLGSDGAQLEALHATLDAVKNPWRNATMHVETIYTEADASHIMHCCMVFMKNLMDRCDEEGDPQA